MSLYNESVLLRDVEDGIPEPKSVGAMVALPLLAVGIIMGLVILFVGGPWLATKAKEVLGGI